MINKMEYINSLNENSLENSNLDSSNGNDHFKELSNILTEIIKAINSDLNIIKDKDEIKVSVLELEQFADEKVLKYLNKYEKKQEKKLNIILNYLMVRYGDQDGPVIKIFKDPDENDISFNIVFGKCKKNYWEYIIQDFWNVCEQINFDDYRFGIICANCL